ncbi:DUF3310 domain-containing protein [Staphylococcus intermedius]|uniref:DUF3310 domain-containing protein n=1 Tax=Staphylococcus intermedius NCTC 11048 TaxID=1141106 RepID=A0A380G800_STAIN|nr:DUF3310 domain-containing protein [Staphylococcus intermedius]PNZ52442.1 DUF3310 domain-containing protein [Staphylococcus intermedius NCTC 11048]SUM47274.1 Uncharacterised protein [Staphylococcus intermedius NCTC 11048]
MKVKDLEIGDRVQVITGVHRYRANERWEEEPIGQTGEVRFKFADGSARVLLDKGLGVFISDDDEWYPIPSSTKIATHDRPAHYGNSEIDYWCERYSPEELRGAFKSQISKYVDRLGYKDDEVKELNKIIDYATRYKNHLKKVKA